jgi:hypothetical protein
MKMQKWVALGVATSVSLIAAAGCNDPVPPSAQGAVQLVVGPVPGGEVDPKENCTIPQTLFKLGEVTGSGRTSVTDGNDGYDVSCTVTPSGGGFRINATISKGADQFGVSGFVQAGEVTQGDVSVNLDAASTQLGGTEKCDIAIVAGPDTPQLAVGEGRVWAQVSCKRLTPTGDATNHYCQAKGVFVFENCNE